MDLCTIFFSAKRLLENISRKSGIKVPTRNISLFPPLSGQLMGERSLMENFPMKKWNIFSLLIPFLIKIFLY